MSTATTPIFPWRAAYSLGNPQIDEQRKGLIRMINDLHEAMMGGTGKLALQAILNDLIRYTESHFASERALLEQRGYSGLAAHKAEHRELTRQVCELRDKFLSGKVTITMDVMRFLKDWLPNHILSRDQAYAKELGFTS